MQMQLQFRVVHSIARAFYIAGPYFLWKSKSSTLSFISCVSNQACVVFKIALFELYTPANDGIFPGHFDSQAEMSVRVRKGGIMVEKLRH